MVWMTFDAYKRKMWVGGERFDEGLRRDEVSHPREVCVEEGGKTTGIGFKSGKVRGRKEKGACKRTVLRLLV